MHPRNFKAVGLLEHRVGDCEVMLGAQCKQSKTIGIHLSYAMLAQDAGPIFVGLTNTRIEVTEKYNFVIPRDLPQDIVRAIVPHKTRP